eukprot:419900-Prymnesium_polylepis.1
MGGVLGSDGCIYGIAYNAERVLRIDVAAQSVSLIGEGLGAGGAKWFGGVLGGVGARAREAHTGDGGGARNAAVSAD